MRSAVIQTLLRLVTVFKEMCAAILAAISR